MPTVSYDAYGAVYAEHAGVDWDFSECVTNDWGLTSHSVQSLNGNPAFALFGLTAPITTDDGAITIRQFHHGAEGPHISQSGILWHLPLPTVTFTNAILYLANKVATASSSSTAVRLFGVKEPHYRERTITSSGYPATERNEFEPQYWKRTRRYKVDSHLWHRRHTTAQVTWTEDYENQVDTYLASPDISSIMNEIVGQDGWQSGNRMCLVFSPNGFNSGNPSLGATFEPDWSIMAGAGTGVTFHGPGSALCPYLELTY